MSSTTRDPNRCWVPIGAGPPGPPGPQGPPGESGTQLVPPAGTNWLKGVNGAMVWSPITAGDLPAQIGGTRETGDWNWCRESGSWMAAGAANAPDGNWYIGTVQVHNDAWVVQTLVGFTQTALPIWRRGLFNGNWGGWTRVNRGPAAMGHVSSNGAMAWSRGLDGIGSSYDGFSYTVFWNRPIYGYAAFVQGYTDMAGNYVHPAWPTQFTCVFGLRNAWAIASDFSFTIWEGDTVAV